IQKHFTTVLTSCPVLFLIFQIFTIENVIKFCFSAELRRNLPVLSGFRIENARTAVTILLVFTGAALRGLTQSLHLLKQLPPAIQESSRLYNSGGFCQKSAHLHPSVPCHPITTAIVGTAAQIIRPGLPGIDPAALLPDLPDDLCRRDFPLNLMSLG